MPPHPLIGVSRALKSPFLAVQARSLSFTTRPSAKQELLKALNEFTTKFNVTPDIVFNLLGTQARVYYKHTYYPILEKSSPEGSSWLKLVRLKQGIDTLRTARPLYANLEYVNATPAATARSQENLNLTIGDRLAYINKLGTNGRTWQEVFTVYARHYLEQQPITYRAIYADKDMDRSITCGTALVKMEIQPFITRFLRAIDADQVNNVMADPISRRAYDPNTPQSNLDYDSMLYVIDNILAKYKLEQSLCNIFAPALLGMLSNNIDYKCYVAPIKTIYEEGKHDFHLGIIAPLAEAIAIRDRINAHKPDSAKLITCPNNLIVIAISFAFVEQYVLPTLDNFLKKRPVLVERAREEYLKNAKLYDDAAFADHNKSTSPNKNRCR